MEGEIKQTISVTDVHKIYTIKLDFKKLPEDHMNKDWTCAYTNGTRVSNTFRILSVSKWLPSLHVPFSRSTLLLGRIN